MDTAGIIGEVAKRQGVLLDRDDPILMIGTMLDLHEADHADTVATMRQIISDGQSQCAALTAEIRALTAAAEKAAKRPLLTSFQIQYELAPKLLAAFDLTRLLVVVALLGLAFGVGMGVHWWRTEALICDGTTFRGRYICYRDNGPAPPDPPAPVNTPAPTPGRH